MMIFAASRVEAAPVGCASGSCAAEQRFEEIAVIGAAPGCAGAAELEAGPPVGRRAELLAGAGTRTQLIIRRALLRASQYFVSFADLLEVRFRILLLAYIRVILSCKLAIRLLDLRFRGVARHAHHLVIVLELHRSPAMRGSCAKEYYASCGGVTIDTQPSARGLRTDRATAPAHDCRRPLHRVSSPESSAPATRSPAPRRTPRRTRSSAAGCASRYWAIRTSRCCGRTPRPSRDSCCAADGSTRRRC